MCRRYCTPETTAVMQLASCAVGDIILKELEGAIDDIHNSEVGWIDVLVSVDSLNIRTIVCSSCFVFSHYYLLRVPLKMLS